MIVSDHQEPALLATIFVHLFNTLKGKHFRTTRLRNQTSLFAPFLFLPDSKEFDASTPPLGNQFVRRPLKTNMSGQFVSDEAMGSKGLDVKNLPKNRKW
jgi:hypothetical protein